MEALLRATEERDPRVLWIRCNLLLDDLRADPWTRDVEVRIGLP